MSTKRRNEPRRWTTTTTTGRDAVEDEEDVESVLDPRVRGLLRGETIRVRGLKMRVETKLWKLCILMTMFVVVWWAQARQAAKANAWADGKGMYGGGGGRHGESLARKFNRERGVGAAG